MAQTGGRGSNKDSGGSGSGRRARAKPTNNRDQSHQGHDHRSAPGNRRDRHDDDRRQSRKPPGTDHGRERASRPERAGDRDHERAGWRGRDESTNPANASGARKPTGGGSRDRTGRGTRSAQDKVARGDRGQRPSARSDRAGGSRGNDARPGADPQATSAGSRHDVEGRAAEQPEPAASPRSAPELPDDVDVSELDSAARRELRTLPKDLADTVGHHLVAAGRLIDTDPEAALAHARYAKSKASRVAIVREAAGLAAYRAGQWSESLSQLRAVRRMTRVDTHVAVIADAERALGRPERALDIAKQTRVATLPRAVRMELRIVAAGARRDLGQPDAAAVTLQGDELDPRRHEPWSARLFYAYADNLAAAGRIAEALRWFLYAADADDEDETDAADRAAELADE